jgi:hypothetical protein
MHNLGTNSNSLLFFTYYVVQGKSSYELLSLSQAGEAKITMLSINIPICICEKCKKNEVDVCNVLGNSCLECWQEKTDPALTSISLQR